MTGAHTVLVRFWLASVLSASVFWLCGCAHTTGINKRGWNVSYDGEATYTTLQRAISMQGGWITWTLTRDLRFHVEHESLGPDGHPLSKLVGAGRMFVGQRRPLLFLKMRSPAGGEIEVVWDGRRFCESAWGAAPAADRVRARQAAVTLLTCLPLPFSLMEERAEHTFSHRDVRMIRGAMEPVTVIDSRLPSLPAAPFPDFLQIAYEDRTGFAAWARCTLFGDRMQSEICLDEYQTFDQINLATCWTVYHVGPRYQLLPDYRVRIRNVVWDIGSDPGDYACRRAPR